MVHLLGHLLQEVPLLSQAADGEQDAGAIDRHAQDHHARVVLQTFEADR